MSAVYATPVSILKTQLTEAAFLEAVIAMEMGLLPDPWRQTGTIAAAAMNAWGGKAKPADFIPRLQRRQGKQTTNDGRPRLSAKAAEFEMRRRFGG